MPRPIHVGDKWGALECVESGSEIDERRDSYVGYSRSRVWYRLVCTCGQEVRVYATEFQGKRLVKDCGCGISNKPYHDVRYRLPVDSSQAVMIAARLYKTTINAAAHDLIQRGWRDLVASDERTITEDRMK